MLFIPAIDLIDGKCVRLLQGDFSKKVEYPSDPADAARLFRDEGARMLHVVDLDAARGAGANNLPTIERIVRGSGLQVEAGGGVRGRERVERLFDVGVGCVVLGTILVKQPSLSRELALEFGERVVAGIDARGGIVSVSGWTESAGVPALEAGLSAKRMGFSRIVYTDIARDGTLEGPNLPEIRGMAEGTGLEVTASGGVSSIEDLSKLKTLEPFGVTGVIAGKAIYEGRLSVREACRLLQCA